MRNRQPPKLALIDCEAENLRRYQQDTRDALSKLSALAGGGAITGLVVCARNRNGEEDLILAGKYRDQPETAFSAAIRMGRLMAEGEPLQDD